MSTSVSTRTNLRDLDSIISNLFSDNQPKAVRRETMDTNNRLDSTLVDVIGQKIQTKGLPLALRKRLMYEQALLAKSA